MWVTIPQIIVQKQAAKGDLSFFDQSPADKRKIPRSSYLQ